MTGSVPQEDDRYVELVEVLDDGQVLVRSSEGILETWLIPLERVPRYRRLLAQASALHPGDDGAGRPLTGQD